MRAAKSNPPAAIASHIPTCDGSVNPPALPSEIEVNDTAGTANDATTNFVAQAASSLYHLGVKATLSSTSDAGLRNTSTRSRFPAPYVIRTTKKFVSVFSLPSEGKFRRP